MKKSAILLFFLGTIVSQISAQNFQWAKQFNSDSKCSAVIIKPSGNENLIITGNFKGTADFDSGNGTVQLTSAGGFDIFIEKTDLDGNFIWVKQFGGTEDENVRGMSIDADGHIYLTGTFKGTTDLAPGDEVKNYTSAGNLDAFLVETDTNGNHLWSGQIGGASVDYGVNIEVAASGNIYVSGYFAGSSDFDPAPDKDYILPASSQSCFIEKLSKTKTLLWAGVIGGPEIDYLMDMKIDKDENIITSGGYSGPADFDPGEGTQILTTAGDRDAFISKLDSTGKYVMAVGMGGNQKEFGTAVETDNDGNIYVAGNFQGTVDFNPASDTQNKLTSLGEYDIFIGKYDANGGLIWIKQIGGSGSEAPYRMTIDNEKNIYTTGYFEGTVDFDPGDGELSFSSAGGIDFYLNKFNNSGEHLWTFATGNTESDRGFSLFCRDNYIYTSGLFSGKVDFKPGTKTFYLNGTGDFTGFIYKLETSYFSNGIYLTENNIRIYPNPTKSVVNISFNDGLSSGNVDVYTSSGKKIISKTLSGQNTVQIDLGTRTGLFFLKVTNSTGTNQVFKLIKE